MPRSFDSVIFGTFFLSFHLVFFVWFGTNYPLGSSGWLSSRYLKIFYDNVFFFSTCHFSLFFLAHLNGSFLSLKCALFDTDILWQWITPKKQHLLILYGFCMCLSYYLISKRCIEYNIVFTREIYVAMNVRPIKKKKPVKKKPFTSRCEPKRFSLLFGCMAILAFESTPLFFFRLVVLYFFHISLNKPPNE